MKKKYTDTASFVNNLFVFGIATVMTHPIKSSSDNILPLCMLWVGEVQVKNIQIYFYTFVYIDRHIILYISNYIYIFDPINSINQSHLGVLLGTYATTRTVPGQYFKKKYGNVTLGLLSYQRILHHELKLQVSLLKLL